MIVDTSALVAIFRREEGYEALVDQILFASSVKASVASILEFQLVIRNPEEVNKVIKKFNIKPLPIDEIQLDLARRAAVQYGRGTGSPARLNFGDCFSYAASKATREPLLFVGKDFAATDIKPALP